MDKTNKKKILIIDDDDEILNLLTTFIEDLGYGTITKRDATSTKKWLSTNIPDLILLDIMLPDVFGIDFCEWINNQDNLKNIPVIHMTACITDDIARKDSMLSGAKDFITKPIDFDVLSNKIKGFIGAPKTN